MKVMLVCQVRRVERYAIHTERAYNGWRGMETQGMSETEWIIWRQTVGTTTAVLKNEVEHLQDEMNLVTTKMNNGLYKEVIVFKEKMNSLDSLKKWIMGIAAALLIAMATGFIKSNQAMVERNDAMVQANIMMKQQIETLQRKVDSLVLAGSGRQGL